jgi:hypothetical protein
MSNWYYQFQASVKGPLSSEELFGRMLSGDISRHCLVKKEGISEWQSAETILAPLQTPASLYSPEEKTEKKSSFLGFTLVSLILIALVSGILAGFHYYHSLGITKEAYAEVLHQELLANPQTTSFINSLALYSHPGVTAGSSSIKRVSVTTYDNRYFIGKSKEHLKEIQVEAIAHWSGPITQNGYTIFMLHFDPTTEKMKGFDVLETNAEISIPDLQKRISKLLRNPDTYKTLIDLLLL